MAVMHPLHNMNLKFPHRGGRFTYHLTIYCVVTLPIKLLFLFNHNPTNLFRHVTGFFPPEVKLV